jgi:hypothetical protein
MTLGATRWRAWTTCAGCCGPACAADQAEAEEQAPAPAAAPSGQKAKGKGRKRKDGQAAR